MSDKVRVAIIGTGGIAHAHSNAYHQIPEIEMVGLCDIVPGKADAFGERQGWSGAKTYINHEDMLEDLEIDAVSVCTPNAAHAEISINCLNAGVHVLCEKPMSVTLEEAVSMARAAKKSGKILTIGFQPRYDPNMAILKDLVQSGILGKIYYVETGGGRRRFIPGGSFINKKEAGYGAVADIGCYSLDMVLNALDYPMPLSASAFVTDYFGKSPEHCHGWSPEEFEVEDFGAAFVRLEPDIALCFKISWAMHMDSLGDTFFLGTEAGLKCHNGGTGTMTIYHDLQGYQTESPIPTRRHNVDIFTQKVRDFIRAVVEGDEAPIPGMQIVRNQAIIDGVMRSAACGHEVTIDIPEI